METFLIDFAVAFLQQASEKGIFGGPFIRLGSLFSTVGPFVYQQAGALGYGLKGQPMLLGKLLFPRPDDSEKLFIEFRDQLATSLLKIDTKGKTFFDIYTKEELKSFGIDITAFPPNKALDNKFSLSQAKDILQIALIKGSTLGFHFSDIFSECWDCTYKLRPESEWQQMHTLGIIQSEKQQTLSLKEAIAGLAEGALAWVNENKPTLLSSNEVTLLKKLAASS